MKFSFKWILIGLVAVFVLYLGGTYNALIGQKGMVEGSWAQVQNVYQSRFDLVPNLQAIVKGAANFEQETLIGVTEARTKWMNASSEGNREEQVAAANQFDSALSRLLVTVESYPQLTATQGFLTFQAQLEGIENRVRVARMDYKSTVTKYNIFVQQFPRMILANLFGFEPEPFFKAVDQAQTAPQINFGE